jgi:hypothetical protein
MLDDWKTIFWLLISRASMGMVQSLIEWSCSFYGGGLGKRYLVQGNFV